MSLVSEAGAKRSVSSAAASAWQRNTSTTMKALAAMGGALRDCAQAPRAAPARSARAGACAAARGRRFIFMKRISAGHQGGREAERLPDLVGDGGRFLAVAIRS